MLNVLPSLSLNDRVTVDQRFLAQARQVVPDVEADRYAVLIDAKRLALGVGDVVEVLVSPPDGGVTIPPDACLTAP